MNVNNNNNEKQKVVTRLITAVIPAYSEIRIVKNSVLSLATQWIPKDSFRLEIIIVDDNPEMDYTYFMSDEFMKLANENVTIGIIKNEHNYGQGISRQIGIDSAHSNWVCLCDEDDMYAPNALYRFWEVLNEQYCGGEDGHPVALIAAPVYGFDKNKERELIHSKSIWVNGKLYNRQFLRDNNLTFPEGENSHHAEDYPFIESLNYAIENNKYYKRVDFDETADTFYYWIPNHRSQSRREKFYTAMLTPLTMNASLMIYNYMKGYNRYNNIETEQEEFMKYKILAFSIYAYYAYVRWLYDMAFGWKDDKRFTEDVWEFYKSVMSRFKEELLVYWGEYLPSNIYDLHYQIKNSSDIRYVESWIEPFDVWINDGLKTLEMSYKEIKKYCSSLKFDSVQHEINAKYVRAWAKRHGVE